MEILLFIVIVLIMVLKIWLYWWRRTNIFVKSLSTVSKWYTCNKRYFACFQHDMAYGDFKVWKSKTRVTSSNLWVTSSNPRVTSSNPRVRKLKARVTRLKARVEAIKPRVG